MCRQAELDTVCIHCYTPYIMLKKHESSRIFETKIRESEGAGSAASLLGSDTYTHVSRLPPEAGFKGAVSPFGGCGVSPLFPFFLAAGGGKKREKRFFGDTPKPRQGTESPAPLLR